MNTEEKIEYGPFSMWPEDPELHERLRSKYSQMEPETKEIAPGVTVTQVKCPRCGNFYYEVAPNNIEFVKCPTCFPKADK